jgi:hypothetical protein
LRAALTSAGRLAQGPSHLWPKAWVTSGEPAGTGPEGRTDLAPSRRRMALPHHRMATLAAGHVTCRFQARGSPGWTPRTLPADAVIRRFRQHGRPTGVLQVSDDGFLSPPCRPSLAQLRTLLETRPSDDHMGESGHDQERPAP